MPASRLPEVTIPLIDLQPVRIKPYRLPPVLDGELHRQLSKLKQAGILEYSTAPYSRPVVLVRKRQDPYSPLKDSYRMVADFRKINLKLAPLYHVLPVPQDAIFRIGQANALLFTVFDNKSGFYSFGIDPEISGTRVFQWA